MIAEKKHYSLRDGAKRPLQAIAQGAVRSARSHNNKLHCAAFNCQLLVFNWVQYIKELRNRRCRRPLGGFPQGTQMNARFTCISSDENRYSNPPHICEN